MSHTEEFNKIMSQTSKKKVKPTPSLIGGGETELQISIGKCSLFENVVYLPIEQLSNYQDVRKALINAGGTYNKNKFIFSGDAKPYIDMLMKGDKVNIKKEYQFFATPPDLARRLVELANINSPDLLVLEPSAGQGAIVKALLNKEPGLIIHAYELMEANRTVLSSIKDCVILGEDFLQGNDHKFDRIVANPPFSKNQDINHVLKMYARLKKGGRIVSITSNSWRTGQQKKQVEFRNWLDSIDARIEDIDAGEFKESGTNISTTLLIIDKL